MSRDFYRTLRRAFGWMVVLFSMTAQIHATVRLPAIFGDHMVLQQEAKLPVWGWAAPGETVTVTFAKQKRSAVAGSDGKWRVDLEPVNPASEPARLTVTGKDNTIVCDDVLVGDVWIVSGQSNMEFGLQNDSRGKEAIASATDSQIRMFFVPWATALQPRTNIGSNMPPSPLNGKWLVCSPEVMAANWAWHGFSAVAYYFARDIQGATKHPLGMIATYKGGTPAQAWTSVSGLEEDEHLTHYVAEHQKLVEHFETAKLEFPKLRADWEIARRQWKTNSDIAKANGHPLRENSAPKPPTDPDGGFNAPGNLFNGMVAPLIPYAIKGVIWYQGEGNGNNIREGAEYAYVFPRMISDWRAQWGQGDFPFLYVQLPNINGRARSPSEGSWAWVRDAQFKTLSLPNTGMAVTIDVGEAENLHPPDKIYVGQRLALAARHIAYGEDVAYSGPIYEAMKVEGNQIRLTFKHAESGLMIGTPPPNAEGKIIPPGDELQGFGIAGDDQKFVWAKAVIENGAVVVHSDEVEHPAAVRYDWAQNPFGNLYGKNGLPASPFRTDDWPAPMGK
ncbi:MAG TPA: sialate O-acetylesterase [Verrucomicrobiae bacterium]|nr:sialate O-acetylesterase [Verrucomicrobiae bacterium]